MRLTLNPHTSSCLHRWMPSMSSLASPLGPPLTVLSAASLTCWTWINCRSVLLTMCKDSQSLTRAAGPQCHSHIVEAEDSQKHLHCCRMCLSGCMQAQLLLTTLQSKHLAE